MVGFFTTFFDYLWQILNIEITIPDIITFRLYMPTLFAILISAVYFFFFDFHDGPVQTERRTRGRRQ